MLATFSILPSPKVSETVVEVNGVNPQWRNYLLMLFPLFFPLAVQRAAIHSSTC
jgi:hypothetical protein